MKNFYQLLDGDSTYQSLKEGLEAKESPQLLVGLSAVHKAFLVYALCQSLQEKAHVVMPDTASALRLCDDLNSLLGFEGAVFFPSREMVLANLEGVSQEYEQARLGVLGNILEDQIPIVVSTIESSTLYTMPPNLFLDYTKVLKTGENYSLTELLQFLVHSGYQRGDQVDGVSQFALRGGILDIFPPSSERPFRIEFWGDEIDSMATFDLLTQRREESVDEVEIIPVREALVYDSKKLVKGLKGLLEEKKGKLGTLARAALERDIVALEDQRQLVSADRYIQLLYPHPATLFDYCSGRLLFVSEPTNIKENLDGLEWRQQEDIKILLDEGSIYPSFQPTLLGWPEFSDILAEETTTLLDTFTRSLQGIQPKGLHQMNAIQLSSWSGDYDLLMEDLQDYLKEDYQVVVFAGTEKWAKILTSDFLALGLPVVSGGEVGQLNSGRIHIVSGGLSAGMSFPDLKLAIISHRKREGEQKRKRRYSSGKKLNRISDLKVGDPVVHVSHGIGLFRGITKREIHGVTKDFIQIQYGGTDALFVPVTQMDLVSKYIGAPEGAKIRLNRLNSLDWQKTRSRVKGAVKEMAKELTQLYAKRLHTRGHAFGPDTVWQKNFEDHFPFQETGDQLQSAAEIKKDMEKPLPMDRLLCGDVGFGKTEVALRGIFKCVMDSKQCAVLVPTTILAWQHFQTFTERLRGYPIKVELLSRFRTPKQQKQILKDLKAGLVDVVVGTHRVVQKDVEFKDLGLCVIDEEQRFGVAHKERFKELRANVDVLTLSATPIPRTLNMALSGLRDMSLIEEPPQDRHPVQTYVLEHQEGVILQAINKEINRGGQVFYLHNNTSTIYRCANNLQKELPAARIEVAHGRMGEEKLSDIWQRLMEQEIDVLVCTTIIETGVDVPNANTLIIEDADNYGLSQLYQIRGRVGRSTRRAYAYLTFRKGKALTDIASKRLTAIREFTTFGSGFQIAMRDLEIRGSGNILGAQQSGHMESVGYEMYLKLLEQAVQEEKGEPVTSLVDCVIDIQLDAYIPERYIHNTAQRIDVYKRISSIESLEDSLDVTDELIDRFGEPPKAVMGLMDVALIRGTAARLGVAEITQTRDRILFYPLALDPGLTSYLVGELGNKVVVNAGKKPYYGVAIPKGKGPLETIQATIDVMTRYKEG